MGSHRHAPRTSRRSGAGQRRALRVEHDRRLAVHPVVDALQPAVPPLQVLGDQVVVRPGHGGVRRRMRPRAEDQPLRTGERLERAERVVAVAVGPSGDDHHRARDRLVGRAQRPELPVLVEALVLEPGEDPGLGLPHAPLPQVAPAVAVDRGHGRERVHRDHVRRVVDEVELLQRAAVVVDVVGVAIVRGEDRDDGLEGRRALHRDLDRVEPAVAGAVHPDVAGGPVLRGEPVDHRDHVGALDGRVLVGRDALAGSGAAHVHPAHHVAGGGEPHVLGPVGRGHVVLAVGEGLEERGPGAVVLREVEGGGEPDAVGHRDVALFGAGHGGMLPGAGGLARRATATLTRPRVRSSP